MMISALLLTLAVEGDPALLQGRCAYSSSLPAPELGELRIFCDSVAIIDNGAAFEFRDHRSGVRFQFAGSINDDSMTIRHLRLPKREDSAATGTCRIYRRNNDISAISCLARIGWRTYVANFESAMR